MDLHLAPATHLGLVDLVVLLVVVLAAAGALKRGAGVLAAAATAAVAAVGCWVAAAVVIAVGPASWQGPVSASGFVEAVHPPVHAVREAADLVLPGSTGEPGPRS